MAFRKHNPNVLPSRSEGGPSWDSAKRKAEVVNLNHPKELKSIVVPCRDGYVASLTTFTKETQNPREKIAESTSLGETLQSISRLPGQPSFSSRGEGKAVTRNSASTFQPSGIHRIPALNRSSFRPGMRQVMTTSIHRIPTDSFHLETLNQSGQVKMANISCNGINPSKVSRHLEVPKTTGFTKYVEAARTGATMSSSTTAAPAPAPAPSFKVYDDIGNYKEPEHALPLTKTVQKYVHELHTLSDTGDRWSAHEAEVLLREMISKYKAGLHDFQPDGGCYNSVIHAYAEAGLPHQAENVMRLMFTDYKNGNVSAQPNVRCLTNVLHAWRKSKDPEAPERCEALLADMYELGDSNSDLPNCKPDTFAVTVLLHCWVESNRPDSCNHAEENFRKMKKRFQDGDESMRPDCISYSILLNTYAQKMMIDDTERILWEMVDDFTLNGNKAAEPRTRNFNTVIAMYARSLMFDAPELAEKVLRRYRDLCSQNLLQNKPDEYSYSLLLKAWCNSKREDGINQALSRLDWMRQLEEDAAFPDVVKYTTIISALARKRDHTGAETLLHRMVNDYMHCKDKRVMPDVPLFDNVIKALTTPDCVSSSSAFRAESLLRNMWYLHIDCGVSVRPKSTTYKHVIIGFKKAGLALRADELLWEMENKSVAKPHKELIQTVMNAWHESTHPEKQKRINTLRLFMNDRFASRESSAVIERSKR